MGIDKVSMAIPYSLENENRWKRESKGLFSDLQNALGAKVREYGGRKIPFKRNREYTQTGTAVYLFHAPYRKEPADLAVFHICREKGPYERHIQNALIVETLFKVYHPRLSTATRFPQRTEIALDIDPPEAYALLRDHISPRWIQPSQTKHWDTKTKAVTEGHHRGPTVYIGGYKTMSRNVTVYEQKTRIEIRLAAPYLIRHGIRTVKDLVVNAENLLMRTLRFERLKPRALRRYGYAQGLTEKPLADALLEIKPEHRSKVKEPLPVTLEIEPNEGALNIVLQMPSFGLNNKQQQIVKSSETKTAFQQKQAFMRWVRGKYGDLGEGKKPGTKGARCKA